MNMVDCIFMGERQDRVHTALRAMDSLLEEVENDTLYGPDTLPGQVELPFIEKLTVRMLRLSLALSIHRQGHANS